jgi:hypothetical protein
MLWYGLRIFWHRLLPRSVQRSSFMGTKTWWFICQPVDRITFIPACVAVRQGSALWATVRRTVLQVCEKVFINGF